MSIRALFSLLVALLLLPLASRGQTIVGGVISDTLWTALGNPYIILSHATVPAGKTLRIKPGVIVKVGGTLSLRIHGNLIVEGISGLPVKMQSNTSLKWRGVKVENGGTIAVQYADISGADTALNIQPTAAALAVSVHHTQLVKNGMAIYAAFPLIASNNTVLANTLGIVVAGQGAGTTLTGNRLCNYPVNVKNSSGNALALANNCWCTTDTAFVHASLQNASSGSLMSFLPLDTACVNGMTFPGDANFDQVVDIRDLLPIGLRYNSTGPARPYASTLFVGQQAIPWNVTLPNGSDVAHVDCDGNGVVDSTDAHVVLQNYGDMHTAHKPTINGSGLWFGALTDTIYSAGDTLRIPVMLGTPDSVVQGLYGLTFSVSYDTAMVNHTDSLASVSADVSDCWIGNYGLDMYSIHKNLPSNGHIDVGITRTNQLNISGNGKVADIIVVLDDMIEKRAENKVLALNFGNITAIDSNQNLIHIGGEPAFILLRAGGTTGNETLTSREVKLWPSPVRDRLRVSMPTAIQGFEIILHDLAGREMLSASTNDSAYEIDCSSFENGIYLAEVRTANGRITKKIVVNH